MPPKSIVHLLQWQDAPHDNEPFFLVDPIAKCREQSALEPGEVIRLTIQMYCKQRENARESSCTLVQQASAGELARSPHVPDILF